MLISSVGWGSESTQAPRVAQGADPGWGSRTIDPPCDAGRSPIDTWCVATGDGTAGSENVFVGQPGFVLEINAASSPAITSRPTIARHLTATLVFFFEALRGCAGSQRDD